MSTVPLRVRAEVAESVSPELLQELRQAAMKATPGPWEHHAYPSDDRMEWSHEVRVNHGDTKVPTICDITSLHQTPDEEESNAAFIALANPQTILALLDRLETQEKLLHKMLEAADDNGTYFAEGIGRWSVWNMLEEARALLAEPKASTPKGE